MYLHLIYNNSAVIDSLTQCKRRKINQRKKGNYFLIFTMYYYIQYMEVLIDIDVFTWIPRGLLKHIELKKLYCFLCFFSSQANTKAKKEKTDSIHLLIFSDFWGSFFLHVSLDIVPLCLEYSFLKSRNTNHFHIKMQSICQLKSSFAIHKSDQWDYHSIHSL